jgi:nicotinamidase-related amidase
MRRALLVIDVQNEYVTGNLPISYPAVSGSLSRIAQAVEAANEAGIPVVVVRQTAPAGSPIFAHGSHGAELHETIAELPRSLLLPKALPSCFVGTILDEWLREREVDTVTIVGYMTQNCDESTARDAAHRGYRVEFLTDATGTLAFENEAGSVSAQTLHETVAVVLQSRFAAVATTDEWCLAVESHLPLQGSSIYASTQRGRAESVATR